MRRWRPYSQRYLVGGLVGLVELVGLVGLVGLALWLGSGLALNKYRCERPINASRQANFKQLHK